MVVRPDLRKALFINKRSDMRIEPGDGLARALRLQLPNCTGIVDDLSLQIGQGNHIVIDHAERADTGSGKIMQHRSAETAGPDNQHARPLQPLLAHAADFRQQDMALVALDFFRAQRVHIALHFLAVMR